MTHSFSSCINPEGTDVVYPAPGDQVFYGGKYSDGSPPVRSIRLSGQNLS